MRFKKFFLALIISLCVLLIQFKVIPLVKEVELPWQQKLISPVDPVEKRKFNLICVLKDNDIEILFGPSFKNNQTIMETILKLEGYPVKVLFSSEKEPLSQLASLQLILKESKIKDSLASGNPPKVIDLTINKPYVTF